MVANALERLGDEDQFDCAGNRARIFQHVRQKLPENLFVEVIEDVVIKYYFFCKLRIGIDERIEAFFKDLLRCFRHDRLFDLPIMAEAAQKILKESLAAFVNSDAELAKKAIFNDNGLDDIYQQIFSELLT